jgi:hypothetical protein
MNIMVMLFSFLLLVPTTNEPTECEDLWKKYGTVPKGVVFENCQKETGQTIKRATYKVAGEEAEEVEAFLIEKYGIGKLHFVCCGWESKNGQNGTIRHKAIKKMNPFYDLDIVMFASAEKQDENGEWYIEHDRTKVEFTIEVRLMEV